MNVGESPGRGPAEAPRPSRSEVPQEPGPAPKPVAERSTSAPEVARPVPDPATPACGPEDFASAVADCEVRLAGILERAGGTAEKAARSRVHGATYRMTVGMLARLRSGDRTALMATPSASPPSARVASPPAVVDVAAVLPSGPAVGPRAAPRARPAAVAGVLGLVGRLPTSVGAAAAGEFPMALARLLGEGGNARSLATYAGLASEVRSGGGAVSPGLLIGAVEEACRGGVVNRGAAFIAAVKRRKGEVLRRRRGEGRGPAAGLRASPG